MVPVSVLTKKLHQASRLSPAPRNWAMRMPATAPTAFMTTEKIRVKFPQRPTAEMLSSPELADHDLVDEVENDARGMLWSVTGTAILASVLTNPDMGKPVFLFGMHGRRGGRKLILDPADFLCIVNDSGKSGNVVRQMRKCGNWESTL